MSMNDYFIKVPEYTRYVSYVLIQATLVASFTRNLLIGKIWLRKYIMSFVTSIRCLSETHYITVTS